MESRKSLKKILILCPSPKGTAATQRLKYEQYLSLLEEEGYRFTISSFQTSRFWKIIYKPGRIAEKIFWVIIGYCIRLFDLIRAPFYDAVFVNLWATPVGMPVYENLLFLFNKRVIYDIDDMVFLSGDSQAKGRFIDRLKGKKKPVVLMKKSRFVIVCTPKLEEIALTLNKYGNVTDISSTFDTKRFVPVDGYRKNEVTTIGWTGTHSTIPYLQMLTTVLQEVSEQRKIRLVVIADKEFHMEGVDTSFIRWRAESEVEDLHNFEIGLYPIPMNEWSLGKSSLKALTYMAIGIPAVATAYGTNFRIIEDGVSGMLAKDHADWVNKIIRLIDDPQLREKIGRAGRKRVEEEFSLQANLPKYSKAFKKAVYDE
jgi:L-malate glycosyltransferase